MDDFEKELKAGFLEEAAQLLSETEQTFLQLESNPEDRTTVEKIFRLAHNLKGSANAVGFSQLGEFTHELESYLLKLKDGRLPIDRGAVDILLRSNDFLVSWVSALQTNFEAKVDFAALASELKAQEERRASAVDDSAHAADAAPANESETETEAEAVQPQEQVSEVPSADAFGDESSAPTEDPIAEALAKATLSSLPAPPPSAPSAPVSAKPASATNSGAANAPEESIRIGLGRLEKLLNFVGEMVILHSVLNEQSLSDDKLLLRKTIHQLGKVTKEVQELSMGLRMIPVRQTFQKMQRIVRDTSSALGKQVNLILAGEDTELDKTVLESIGDPLVHLIRNAVDHGVEGADLRRERGKPAAGEVRLSAYHQSGSLMIEIKDDGGGLDPAKLRAKAVEKGIVPANRALSDQEAYQLIFASGFSTKAQTTDISGRGVGMDVVRTNIERLKGDIHIETELGKFTCFKIRLPLTLAIIDGMVVTAENARYVIPLAHVHESVRPAKEDLHFVTGMGDVFSLRGENLPLYRLSGLLGTKGTPRPAPDCIAIVVRTLKHPFAILVDDILNQTQVVIKKLGAEHSRLVGFSGSAILGDGKPALILELPELLAKQNRTGAAPRETAPRENAPKERIAA
ncbi:MAG: chemotaxis protein CheA [Bdellovibrionales bacterium]|nr:chemotaxis protein CheA [Bdellovibrionales bacterium]